MHDLHGGVRWIQEVYKPLQWYCDLGHETPHLYSTREELDKHLTKMHSHKLTAQNRAIFADGSSILSRRPPNTCPLCNCVPDSIREIMNRYTASKTSNYTKRTHSSRGSRALPPIGRQVTSNPSLDKTVYLAYYDDSGDARDDQGLSNKEDVLLRALEKHIANHLRDLAFISIRNLLNDEISDKEVISDVSAQAHIEKQSSYTCKNSRNADFDNSPFVFDDTPPSEQATSVWRTGQTPERSQAPEIENNHGISIPAPIFEFNWSSPLPSLPLLDQTTLKDDDIWRAITEPRADQTCRHVRIANTMIL